MKRNIARKNNWGRVIVVLLAIVMLAGAIGAGINYLKKDTKRIHASAFSVGGLTANGKYLDTKNSVYTKDAFECKGLHIVPKFESAVSYVVYFYDNTGAFLEKTETLTEEFKDSVPTGAKTARIVITPNGEKVEIKALEAMKFAKQLDITVSAKIEKTSVYPITLTDKVRIVETETIALEAGKVYKISATVTLANGAVKECEYEVSCRVGEFNDGTKATALCVDDDDLNIGFGVYDNCIFDPNVDENDGFVAKNGVSCFLYVEGEATEIRINSIALIPGAIAVNDH